LPEIVEIHAGLVVVVEDTAKDIIRIVGVVVVAALLHLVEEEDVLDPQVQDPQEKEPIRLMAARALKEKAIVSHLPALRIIAVKREILGPQRKAVHHLEDRNLPIDLVINLDQLLQRRAHLNLHLEKMVLLSQVEEQKMEEEKKEGKINKIKREILVRAW